MKTLLIALIFLASCSSTKKEISPDKVTNEAFKKEKALAKTDVKDFYSAKMKSMNPALQDETLDRLSEKELSNVNSSGDPLIDISVMCARKDFSGGFKMASANFNRYQKVPQYWNLIANCHLNQGSFRKALLFYNKALEVSPNYVPALNNIGVMYSRQGQDQKALVAFERANKQSKFSKTPRYNLAKLYLTYGLVESALPLFQSLLNESPQDVDLLNAVAHSYFFMSDYAQAYNYFQKIPQDQWSRAEIGLNLAVTLKKLNRPKDSNTVFEKVETPSDSSLKRYYASVEAQLGDSK